VSRGPISDAAALTVGQRRTRRSHQLDTQEEQMRKRATTVTLLVATLALGAGCAGSPNQISEKTNTASPEFKAQAEEIVNRYAQALYNRDVTAMEDLLASEVLTRMKEYQGGLPGFVEQQRRMMLKTFNGMESQGLGGGFQVTKVTAQEGAAAVTLSRNGVDVPKAFHFVLEEGGYRLNIARKGFTKPLPPGAAAADNYNVKNDADYPVWAECEGGGSISVRPWSTGSVSCPNRCGRWFAGARFDGSNWIGQTHNCDYNTWGDDVIHNQYFNPGRPYIGMVCNDRC
jgi:hypothetical protein